MLLTHGSEDHIHRITKHGQELKETNILLKPIIKISALTDILVLEFYEYIGGYFTNISMDFIHFTDISNILIGSDIGYIPDISVIYPIF